MNRSNLATVDTPIDTLEGFTTYLRRNERKYRDAFRDDEQYELFMMLPVDESTRRELMGKLLEERKAEPVNANE